jgi:hypothetical protein
MCGLSRMRTLLAPALTELEWLVNLQLEQWADVASFDAPARGRSLGGVSMQVWKASGTL